MKKCIAAVAAVVGMAFAAQSADEMLYHMSFETIGDGGVALQNDDGTLTSVTPQLVDSGYINYITSAGTFTPKFGSYSYRSNGGTIGIIDDTNGLVSVDTGFTISFWFYPESISNWRSFFGFGFLNGNNYGYEKNGQSSLQINGYGYTSDGEKTLNQGISINASAWNHFALVCEPNASSVKIYINGTAYDVAETSGMTGSLSQILLTRRRNTTGASAALRQNKQTVCYDEFALYNFAMTSEQIAWLGENAASADIIGTTEVVDCGSAYSASTANAFSTTCDKIKLNFDAGATFTIDEALTRTYNLVCEGNLTLVAGESYTPTASDFAYLKVAGVTGNLIRSWVTTESNSGVYGFNFNAAGARNGSRDGTSCNETSIALEIGDWAYNLYSPSGSTTNFFNDGLSTLTWSAKNVYSETDGCSGSFIKGYLDDGNGITITISHIPYASYDLIIYCSTDDDTKSFTAKTVNGTIYAWDDAAGGTVETNSTTATWGLASKAAGKAVYGANTLRVNGLSGALTLNSVVQTVNGNNGARGCISAIQIMPAGTSTAPTLTLTEDANWTTAANWNTANIPTSGPVIVNVTGDVTLTVDEAIALGTVTVSGTGSLKIVSDTSAATIENITSEVPVTISGSKISAPSIYADATWECAVDEISTTSYNHLYKGGAGSVADGVTNAVQIALAGGSATLTGETYYLMDGYNGTLSTVVFTNATAVYTNGLSLGNAAYVMAGDSTVTLVPKTGEKPRALYLVDGVNNRTATLTLKDSAKLVSQGLNNVDSNAGAVLFGHYNGTSVFTMQDNASFSTLGEVLVSKTSGNNTINISGGTFTAQGIKVSAGAGGTQAFNFSGGELVLGDIGISAYGSYTMPVNVTNSPTIKAFASTMPFTQPLAIAAESVLNLTTTAAATEVTMTGAFSGDGGVSVGENITLALGTESRPRIAALAGKLKITMSDDELSAGKITLPTSLEAVPDAALVSVYDGESEVSVGAMSIADGTLTIPFEVANLITVSTKVSELDSTLSGAITVAGSSEGEPIVFDFDADLPEGVTGVAFRGTVVVKGTVPSTVTFAANAVIITEDDQSLSNDDSTVTFITRGGMLTLSGNALKVQADTNGTFNVNGNHAKLYPIVLNGGTLMNAGSEVNDTYKMFPYVSLISDSFIDTTNEFGCVASGYASLSFALNGHKLTKKGPGVYHISTATLTGGGTLDIQEGTLRFFKGTTIPTGTTLNLIIAQGATLRTDGAVSNSGTINLDNEGLWTMSLESNAAPALGTRTGNGSVWIKNCNNWSAPNGNDDSSKMNLGYYVAEGATAVSTGNSGWLPFTTSGTRDFGFRLKVVDEEATAGTTVGITFADGSLSKYRFAALEGDGTVVVNTKAQSAAAYIFCDATNFTGNVTAQNRPIVFGTSATSSTEGTITVNEGVGVTVAAGKTWQATGTVTVNGDIGGSGTLKGSTVSLGNGITFTYDGDPMTITGTPSFGKRLYVKGGLNPNDYLFIVDSQPDTLPKITLVDENGNPTGALWTKYVTEGTTGYIQVYTPGMRISIK
ncbi:MAG: LamG domain-containing protein [Kiritimatiellae bacterium]|nr:LamG domain-containing protein [Kiritimatiellia bacterium]